MISPQFSIAPIHQILEFHELQRERWEVINTNLQQNQEWRSYPVWARGKEFGNNPRRKFGFWAQSPWRTYHNLWNKRWTLFHVVFHPRIINIRLDILSLLASRGAGVNVELPLCVSDVRCDLREIGHNERHQVRGHGDRWGEMVPVMIGRSLPVVNNYEYKRLTWRDRGEWLAWLSCWSTACWTRPSCRDGDLRWRWMSTSCWARRNRGKLSSHPSAPSGTRPCTCRQAKRIDVDENGTVKFGERNNNWTRRGRDFTYRPRPLCKWNGTSPAADRWGSR